VHNSTSKTFEEVGKVEDFDVVSSVVEKLQPGGRLGKILADKEIHHINEKSSSIYKIQPFTILVTYSERKKTWKQI
jgi:hypothetical protein